MKIKYTLIHKDNKARLGKIETNYGTYDTPMFMPVGTRGTVKGLKIEDVKEVKTNNGSDVKKFEVESEEKRKEDKNSNHKNKKKFNNFKKKNNVKK